MECFKERNSFEKRESESTSVLNKYPDRIPAIVEKDIKSTLPQIDKHKFLIPKDLTLGQFVYIIRRRMKITSDKAIFIFVQNILPPSGELIGSIYEKYKDVDGFLYITYCSETTFGF